MTPQHPGQRPSVQTDLVARRIVIPGRQRFDGYTRAHRWPPWQALVWSTASVLLLAVLACGAPEALDPANLPTIPPEATPPPDIRKTIAAGVRPTKQAVPTAAPTAAPTAVPTPSHDPTAPPAQVPAVTAAPGKDSAPHASPAPTRAQVPQPTVTASVVPAPTPTLPPVSTPTPKIQTFQGLTFKQYGASPLMTIDADAGYVAIIRTNMGTIVLELFPKSAPITVNNFVFLAQEGFYGGLVFHRVIKNFMIQSGDPTGTGKSGPGYQFEDEIDKKLVFDRLGRLAMANSGPNTNGSQFFITTVPTPHLDGAHTIFGQVIQGQDVVDAISKVDTDGGGRPSEPIIIEEITIIAAEGTRASVAGEAFGGARAAYLEASTLANEGQFEKSIEKFDEAIRLYPEFPSAYNNRGIAHRALGQYERAIQDYSQAIGLDSSSPETYNNRGNVFRDMGQYRRALEDYDQAIRLDPNYAQAYSGKARTYTFMGNDAEAERSLEKAVELGYQRARLQQSVDEIKAQR